ncbi:hypothetical protein KGF57_002007 [Candida theae]|uniref:Uncharacterized protein n=1 Tax=Candida theae TaxID=1198502 RepID=A0AAD5FZA1_9ASCO|nr:uncharacterized protein KGF57_002007 [Candida theae]KAI5960007.1 hypothetical protein KGF57_002007 [Candida theae]
MSFRHNNNSPGRGRRYNKNYNQEGGSSGNDSHNHNNNNKNKRRREESDTYVPVPQSSFQSAHSNLPRNWPTQPRSHYHSTNSTVSSHTENIVTNQKQGHELGRSSRDRIGDSIFQKRIPKFNDTKNWIDIDMEQDPEDVVQKIKHIYPYGVEKTVAAANTEINNILNTNLVTLCNKVKYEPKDGIRYLLAVVPKKRHCLLIGNGVSIDDVFLSIVNFLFENIFQRVLIVTRNVQETLQQLVYFAGTKLTINNKFHTSETEPHINIQDPSELDDKVKVDYIIWTVFSPSDLAKIPTITKQGPTLMASPFGLDEFSIQQIGAQSEAIIYPVNKTWCNLELKFINSTSLDKKIRYISLNFTGSDWGVACLTKKAAETVAKHLGKRVLHIDKELRQNLTRIQKSGKPVVTSLLQNLSLCKTIILICPDRNYKKFENFVKTYEGRNKKYIILMCQGDFSSGKPYYDLGVAVNAEMSDEIVAEFKKEIKGKKSPKQKKPKQKNNQRQKPKKAMKRKKKE